MTHATGRHRAARYLPSAPTYCRAGDREGVVWNVSATGLVMMVASAPEVGERLPVEVSSRAGRLALTATVARVQPMDGDAFVGLHFCRPLVGHELARLVGPRESAAEV